MNRDNNQSHFSKIAGLSVITFVVLVVALSITISYLNDQSRFIKLVNIDDVNSTILSQNDIKHVKQQLYQITNSYYPDQSGKIINASVRPATYSEAKNDTPNTIEFVLDVDELEATYHVWLIHDAEEAKDSTVSFTCASPDVSKFPTIFCLGTEGSSSIETLFNKGQLPYKGYIDGFMQYKVYQQPYESLLYVDILAWCEDKDMIERAKNEALAWIDQSGMDHTQLPIKINEDACSPIDETSIR